MTTAESLNNLTDRSKFEAIANAYLRERFPVLSNLIASGINIKGETVKGRPDSYTKIGEYHFALVEHTTNDSSLEKKWLFDKKNYTGRKAFSSIANGDLIDAIGQAEIIRKSIPNATFTIYLTTNGTVKSELFIKTIAVGNAAQINIEIIDVSAIAHFLDTDPSGQYLRKLYFNIDQELLSSELFLQLQAKNFDQFRRSFFINDAAVIDHWQLIDVEHLLNSSNKLLTLLVADSGMGKTTLAYTLLKKQIEEKTRVLWVTPELVNASSDPVNLVESAVKHLHDKVFFNGTSRQLLTGEKLVLLVDDINRSDRPNAILNKLISWGIGSENEDFQQYRIICPIWPRYFYEISESERKDEAYNYLELIKPSAEFSRMLVAKGIEALGANLTLAEINLLAESNGNDPLLIGLNIQLVKKAGCYVANQSKQVIADFILDKLAEVCRETQIPQFKHKRLLSQIGKAMVSHLKIHPNYTDFLSWFDQSSEVVSLIDKLCVQQEVFLIDEIGQLQFRHDRIRDYIIAEGFKLLLKNVHEHLDLFSEPFFAETLALALVDKRLEQEDLMHIIAINPEAVFNMLKFLQSDIDSEYFELTLSVIENWKNAPSFPAYNREMMNGVNWVLLHTDTKEISRITNKLPNERILNLALLRNGNAVGGVNYLLSFNDFEPFWGNSLRDIILNHARTRHLPQLKLDLQKIIETNKALHPKVKSGIFLLAGYLQLSGIAAQLRDLWEEDEDQGIFIYYLWSMINCANAAELDVLRYCFDQFQTLLDKDKEDEYYGKDSRNKIAYWFSESKWLLTNEQVVLLDELYDEYPQLISSFFGKIDHPIAMRRTVFTLGDTTSQQANFHSFRMHPQERWDYKKNKYRLSAESLGFLQSIWKNKVNPGGVRSLAYRIWAGNEMVSKVVELSRKVTADDKTLYEKTVVRRVELNDRTAISAFFPIIKKHRHYMDRLKYVWSSECKVFYDAFILEKAHRFGNEEFLFDYLHFLTELPLSEAEDVLKTNWKYISYDGFAIQSALYVGSPEMLTMVADSVRNHPDPKLLFRHIDFTYHFIDANNYKIAFSQIVALEPYIQYFEPFTLRWLSEYCLKVGQKEWAINKLYIYLKQEDKIYLNPTIKDLVAEMQSFKRGDPHFQAGNLLNNFKRRGVKKETALKVFEEFSLEDKSAEALKLLAGCLSITGHRQNVELLKNYDDIEFLGVNKQQLYETVLYAVRKRTVF